MESAFGITEYVSREKLEPIPCLLKEMYTDFIVREIYGEPRRVLRIPKPDEISKVAEPKPEICIRDDIEKPSFLNDDILKQLNDRFESKGDPVIIPTTDLSKENRTQIHRFIREKYCGRLNSETTSDSITVSHGHTASTRKRTFWDEKIPVECHFSLAKENKDTNYALSIVSKFLNASLNRLHIHGIKDKRAVTVQRVSCHKVLEKQVMALNSRLRGMVIFDCEYSNDRLKMGGHWGNQFSIVLRNLPQGCENEIERRLQNVKTLGFVNYFGTQRFGSRESNTAEVGLYIIKKDWQNAIKSILKNTLPDHSYHGTVARAIRTYLNTGNSSKAFNQLKGTAQAFATTEGRILKQLSIGRTWKQTFFEAIPMQTRSLYVHAYQSLIWNKVSSKRIQEGGAKVTPDDVGSDGNPLSADSEHFDIHIPLPGLCTNFKDAQVMKWVDELLAADGINHSDIASLQDNFSLSESSRPLFMKLEDVEWKFVNYAEPKALLQDGLETKAIPEEEQKGDLLALKIVFSLPSGSYATVALREITGEDMGKAHMKSNSEKMKEGNEEVKNDENGEDVGDSKKEENGIAVEKENNEIEENVSAEVN